jgi:hypothetical protein
MEQRSYNPYQELQKFWWQEVQKTDILYYLYREKFI